MRMWFTVGGAALGARALRLPGIVLGAGLGWGLAALLDLRQRVAQLEEAVRLPPPKLRPRVASAGISSPGFPRERYPEMAVIDAVRETGGEEMADLFDEVSGRRSNGGGKK